jgi:hypothetical protein
MSVSIRSWRSRCDRTRSRRCYVILLYLIISKPWWSSLTHVPLLSLCCFVHQIVAFSLRPHEIKTLRDEFEKVDTTSSGEITVDGLSKALQTSGLLSPNDLDMLVKNLDTIHT